MNKIFTYAYADEISATELLKYLEHLEKTINNSWSKITHDTPYYYSDAGKNAMNAWEKIIKDLYAKLSERTKKIKLKTSSGKTLTIAGGSLYVDKVEVVKDASSGYVHLSSKGNATSSSRGQLHFAGAFDNQLQGNTYVAAHNRLIDYMLDGKTWNEINSEDWGRLSSEWESLKKYLDL